MNPVALTYMKRMYSAFKILSATLDQGCLRRENKRGLDPAKPLRWCGGDLGIEEFLLDLLERSKRYSQRGGPFPHGSRSPSEPGNVSLEVGGDRRRVFIPDELLEEGMQYD